MHFRTLDYFNRKTRSGMIIKTLSERYLRDDIWCGNPVCKKCPLDQANLSTGYDLKTNGNNKIYPQPHQLLIDVETFINQIDVLEEKVLSNVILLTSVLRIIRSKSLSVFRRILDILHNPRSHIFLFDDTNNRHTYQQSDTGSTSQAAIRQRLLTAFTYLNTHIKESQTILITDDMDLSNSALFEYENAAIPFVSYVDSIEEGREILSPKLRRVVEESQEQNALFPEHETSENVRNGLMEKTLFQGTFRVSGYNFLQGSVEVQGYKKSILVQGYRHINRAIDGDVVVIRILPQDQWTQPTEMVVEDSPNVPLEDIENQIDTQKDLNEEKQATGVVVSILVRNWRPLCGIIENFDSFGKRLIFTPADRKYPRVRIEHGAIDELKNKKLIVVIDDWSRNSRYPIGHFVRIIGEAGNKEVETQVILLEHDIRHTEFSERVCSFLPKLPWAIPAEELSKRQDLRSLNICSVDPPGCTDIDDALHCAVLPNGDYEVGVHIADVTYFIRPGNDLDIEASERGTTVYLVDRRIDMVPEVLSSNLCSLLSNVDRLAFSCIWVLDKNANILKTQFMKTIIESKHSFTYEQAQNRIDDTLLNDDVTESLRELNKLAKNLKQRRLDNGALLLSSPEVRFSVDSETHDPVEVKAKQCFDTNSMVEEFMLLANISVAQKIYEEFPGCAMLRKHPAPSESQLEPLVKAATNQKIDIDVSSNKALAASLNKAIVLDRPYFNTIIRIMTTRCMQQAQYFSSGSCGFDDFYHYGLALPLYTHFTSPIRRYADIIVHRLLAVCIGADKTYGELLDQKAMNSLCNNLNYRNRMAQYAGRASVAFNTNLYFRDKQVEENAYILFVRKNALQVLIPKFGLEGTVYLEPRNNDGDKLANWPEFVFDEQYYTQTFENITLKAFDHIRVILKLDTNNIQHEKVVLAMTSPINLSKMNETKVKTDNTTQQAVFEEMEEGSVPQSQESNIIDLSTDSNEIVDPPIVVVSSDSDDDTPVGRRRKLSRLLDKCTSSAISKRICVKKPPGTGSAPSVKLMSSQDVIDVSDDE